MVLGNTLSILRPPDRSTPSIQTGWNEDLIRNMHKVLGELAQQITAQTFGGLPEGIARPAIVKANVFWLDITSATAPIVKLFDGTDDITVMTFNYTANTVIFPGVLTSFDVVDDTSPQLGGDLDLNGNVITGLEIGTNIQAFDATLDSLAALAGVVGDVIYASGTDTWARLAKGSDDEVLTLASGLPAWAVIPAPTVGLIALAVFTSDDTWTPNVNATTARITCTAGGGGGDNAATNTSGGGGGAGATAIVFVADSVALGAQTVTIGGGGSAQNDGNASSVGTVAVAGKGIKATTTSGASGGTATAGDLLIKGGSGNHGGANDSKGGRGGASWWGGDGAYGSGGAGGDDGGGGNSGFAGVVMIEEW